MRGSTDVSGNIHYPHIIIVGGVLQRAPINVVPTVVASHNYVLPGIAAVNTDLNVFISGQCCSQRTVQRQRGIVGNEVAAAQPAIIADAINGDGFSGVWCDGINSHHLASVGADITCVINNSQLIVAITIGQRTAIDIRPAQTADADVSPCATAIQANLRVIAIAQRRPERSFQADLVVAGNKVVARQSGILGNGIHSNGRGRRCGQVNHHVPAVRCADVTRIVDHTNLILVRSVCQGSAVGVAPLQASDGQINPSPTFIKTDLCFLVITKLCGQ